MVICCDYKIINKNTKLQLTSPKVSKLLIVYAHGVDNVVIGLDMEVQLLVTHNAAWPIVVTVDAMHRPVEFFLLHAGIADYFHHGGQRFQNFGLQPMKRIKLSVSL